MTCFARLPFAATALILLVACQGDRALTPPLRQPSAAISDGTHVDGNRDFFFLPPISNPRGDPDFGDRPFNAGLRPSVAVCELSGDPLGDDPMDPSDDVSCVATVFGPVGTAVSVGEEQYHVNWHTNASNGGAGLDVAKFYRIEVFTSAGGVRLGYADVNPVATGKELKHLDTGEIVGLVDGRTLPIKFRVEQSALCDPSLGAPCTSRTVDLSQGGSVVLSETGDRVDIPAQNSNQIITVTLTLCDGIDVDLPQFGNCLTVHADPPLAQELSPPATVSMCSIAGDPDIDALGESHDYVTMYRQDDGDVFALPHAEDFCSEPIGGAPADLLPRLRDFFVPQPLHATTVVLNVGDAGDTRFFSDFRLVLPGQMTRLEGTAEQTGEAGSAVEIPPGVTVLDPGENPVAGATVHFEVTAGLGAVTPVSVVTGADGVAQLESWVLGDAVTNTVRAFGRAIADEEDAGPFMPTLNEPEAEQILTTTGAVLFNATTGEPDLVISSGEPDVDPELVAPGGRVALAGWTIQNQGTAAIPPASEGVNVVNVAYFLSPDAEITRTDVFLGSTHVTSDGMAAGEVLEGPPLAFIIPIGIVPGNYWIGILADQDNSVAESNETNNDVSTTLTVVIAGSGTATLDGLLGEEEWSDAGCLNFDATIPEGGTTPARFCLMNDAAQLYVLVRFDRSSDARSAVDITFDVDGSHSTTHGDDRLDVDQVQDELTTLDDFWDQCSPTSLCSDGAGDGRSEGGTQDIAAAFANNGTESVFEISHPLASGDAGDIALKGGDTIRYFLGLNIGDASGLVRRTFVPGFGMGSIVIR